MGTEAAPPAEENISNVWILAPRYRVAWQLGGTVLPKKAI
jgi:hypothetical protein